MNNVLKNGIVVLLFIVAFNTINVVNAQNDTLKLCSDNYHYCIDVINLDENIKLSSGNNGSFTFSIERLQTKGVVVGTNYKGGHLGDMDMDYLKNVLFVGWREMDISPYWTTRHNFETENTATFIVNYLKNNTLMTSYRFIKYDNNTGYVEMLVDYPSKHETIIRPMIEQMSNSIEIK